MRHHARAVQGQGAAIVTRVTESHILKRGEGHQTHSKNNEEVNNLRQHPANIVLARAPATHATVYAARVSPCRKPNERG